MLVKNPKLHEILKGINIKDIKLVLELAEDLKCESPVLKAIFSVVKTAADSTGVVNEELFNQMVNAEIETKKQ